MDLISNVNKLRILESYPDFIDIPPGITEDQLTELIKEYNLSRRVDAKGDVIVCSNDETFLGTDVALIGNKQLYIYRTPGTDIYHCFDVDDVSFLIDSGKNPYNNVRLTQEDISSLKEWRDALPNELGSRSILDLIKGTPDNSRELSSLDILKERVSDLIGKYNSYPDVIGFFTLPEEYILLFKKYYNFNTSETEGLINDVLEYLESGGDDISTKCLIMSKIIDEITYMARNKLTYEEMKREYLERGEHVYLTDADNNDIIMVRNILSADQNIPSAMLINMLNDSERKRLRREDLQSIGSLILIYGINKRYNSVIDYVISKGLFNKRVICQKMVRFINEYREDDVKYMLDMGIPCMCEIKGFYPVQWAAISGNTTILSFFTTRGAPVQSEQYITNNRLWRYLILHNRFDTIKQILSSKNEQDTILKGIHQGKNDRTPLDIAITLGNAKAAKMLQSLGVKRASEIKNENDKCIVM